MTGIQAGIDGQKRRNSKLLKGARYLGEQIISEALPLHLDIGRVEGLTEDQIHALEALQIVAARTAVRSLASLARIGELDHLGGALGLIPSLTLSLAVTDFERVEYTIEHAHTSMGYFASLAAYGYLEEGVVIEQFRRGLDIPGHVSWLPGGTQLNGGRLGVMVPVAVGQALGKRAVLGEGAWVVTHCGDASWISGQALNGYNGADVHGAPITFVMDRNGIQLSGATRSVMDKDPRPVVEAQGIEILEIPTLHDVNQLYQAYREGYRLAREGRPSLIYPTGFATSSGDTITLDWLADWLGIRSEAEAFAAEHGVAMAKEVWIPGSLMSFRDVVPMLECIFLVNGLPGGEGHHDGHMKGRSESEVLANPMLQLSPAQQAALDAL
ncbi:thiamine pyrophosphate-dependent enzyme, partial [Candidatus Latescibacterota bacterium]